MTSYCISVSNRVSYLSLEVYFVQTVYIKGDVDFVWHRYQAELEEKPAVTISAEHSAYRWLTLGEAVPLPLIPGEVACIELVYGPQKGYHRAHAREID